MGLATALFLLASAATAAQPAPERPAAPPAVATDWESAWIIVGQDAGGVVWLVRAGDMINTANYRPAVWVTKDHSQDRSTKARLSRSLQVFDCMAGTTDVRATIGFSPGGAVLWNAEAAHPDPRPIAASSIADLVRKSVCPKSAPAMTSH